MAKIAKSLDVLRAQINAASPNRNKSSDGWIGDPAHAARKSEHNPNANGVVRALDITDDPANGVDASAIADAIRASGDRRVLYVISDKRIANPGQPWRSYTGSNPHTKHFHVSVVESATLYDDASAWSIGKLSPDVTAKPAKVYPETLWPRSKHEDVAKLKAALVGHMVKEEGYGPITEAAVRAFQKRDGLTVDGVVGPYTWEALT